MKTPAIVDVKIGDLIISATVDTGCTQAMVKSNLIPSQVGKTETSVSMVCIYRASYTYKRKKLRLTVIGHTDTLPCPILLGIDWPYLKEVVGQAMRNLKIDGFRNHQDRGFIGIDSEGNN